VHESVIALGIVREVDRVLKERGPLRSVEIVLGELQSVDEEVLAEYIKLYSEEQGLRDFTWSFRREKARFRCSACGHEWGLEESGLSEYEREAVHFLPEAIHAILKCPRCGSSLFDVIGGRGVKLVFEE